MKYKIGDIVLLPFPFTDLSSHKIRPAVVIAHHDGSADYTVAFISSIPSSKHFYEIAVETTEEGFKDSGLKTDSVIKVSKIATLDTKIVIGKLGVMPQKVMGQIKFKLKKLFQL